MNKFTTLTLAALVFVAGVAQAQEQYDAGIFADAAGTISTAFVSPGAAFDLYAVAFELDGAVHGFEVKINGLLESGAIVIDQEINGQGLLLESEFYPDLNFIVTTGACLDGAGAYWILRVSALHLIPVAADTAVCIGGTTPSSFGGVPGYFNCSGGAVPFGVAQVGGDYYPDACFILNPTHPGGVVATDVSSFGEVKARY